MWIVRGQVNLREHWPLRPKIGRSELWASILEKQFGWSDGFSVAYNSDGTVSRRSSPDFFAPPDISRFRDWCDKAVAVQTLPENHWERLALAQHYGLATRFLDWTEKPLVALFFASISGDDIGQYGAVYGLLRPQTVTKHVSGPLARTGERIEGCKARRVGACSLITMSLSEEGFEEMTRHIAAANNLPLEIAGEYAVYIGDTPELADDGRVIVRDDSGVELARIILPTEE